MNEVRVVPRFADLLEDVAFDRVASQVRLADVQRRRQSLRKGS